MIAVALAPGADLDGFRAAVRRLVAAGARPEEMQWSSEPSLFAASPDGPEPAVTLPRPLADLIRLVVCHRDADRYGLLYTAIWRTLHGERRLLDVATDPLVHRLERMAKSVRRDLHKMHAFVRFRRLEEPDGERFVAWFEPDHHILDATAAFFVERFKSLDWTILTPEGRLRWDGERLHRGPPATRAEAPGGDPFEVGWTGYYENTFNPALVNMTVTRGHMAKKYWKSMPETAVIPAMVRSAPARVREMIEREAAVPARREPTKAVAAMADQAPQSLEALNRLIAAAPPMVEGGTRAVLGEGQVGAAIAFVGEQPGDQEDVEGRPFVGPAGQLLDRMLAEAGIDRSRTYVTNAVKHFKFARRGKRRLHQSPTAGEVKHYRWWLKTELDLVSPGLVVALGGTALLALTGKPLAVKSHRGETELDGRRGFVTVHPSYLLRIPDPAEKAAATDAFRADLDRIRALAD